MGKRRFNSSAPLLAPSGVENRVFNWPSTSIAKPDVGNSERAWAFAVDTDGMPRGSRVRFSYGELSSGVSRVARND